MTDQKNIATVGEINDWSPNKWAVNIALLIISASVAYKVAITSFTLQIDFLGLLSMLLALFAVGLSALFYFKATETSNTFYDNTYKYTKDIAQLLVKIESGFGERLKHLDEGYSSMRNYLQNIPSRPNGDVEKTKEKLATEELEVEKIIEERNKIVQELVEKSELQEEEKRRVLAELRAKEEELQKFQHEVNKLNKRLLVERMNSRSERNKFPGPDTGIYDFTFHEVVRRIGIEKILNSNPAYLRGRFNRMLEDLPSDYINDLEKNGLFNDGLTLSGVRFIRDIASRHSEEQHSSDEGV
jgi:hypothetical protein